MLRLYAEAPAMMSLGLHMTAQQDMLNFLQVADEAGFEVEGLYGWFDARPYGGEEDMIFVARRRD